MRTSYNDASSNRASQTVLERGSTVIDPVCKMPLDPATAAASIERDGEHVYFCSASCHKRFLANPSAYKVRGAVPDNDSGALACAHSTASFRPTAAVLGVAAGAGLIATALLLGFYFGLLTVLSGWAFTLEQFNDYWPFITALAIGFGIQVGLFTYLHQALHAAASGKVVAATGTTSGAAMVSCCSHYLVNLLPALGATGLVSFVGQYQIELFWVSLAFNLAGIVYIGHRVFIFSHGALEHVPQHPANL